MTPEDYGCLAIEAWPDAAAITDRSGAVLHANSAFCSMLGIRADALLTQPFKYLANLTELNVSELISRVETGRKADILVFLEGSRQALASIRRYGIDPITPLGLVIVMRDLAVLDHERQRAAADGAKPTFRFLNQQRFRADLAHQRRISKHLDQLLEVAERAMNQNARVFLYGESGVGKTEIARYLHEYVSHEPAAFIHVNCGAIPETLFESEMFGYEKGAFTGALQTGKKGLIEAADGGTLFLDEIGEIPLVMQAKMLKFLETGSILRVGASAERSVKVRVMSATNRDLKTMVEHGQFRRDLYYRLAVVPLHIRPLRDSRELIRELIGHFVSLINQRREPPLQIEGDCLNFLMAYSYPGNIRELQNVIQQISVYCDAIAELRHIPESILEEQKAALVDIPVAGNLKGLVAGFELQIIRDAIATHGSKRKAAEALGVDIGTIVRKTQSLKSPAG